MNDTPTPRTSQIWGGLLVPYPFLSNCVNDTAQMEKELAAVTEQRDAVTLRLGDTQVRMFNAERQRDRLAEALKDALYDLETSDGLMACDNEEGHSLFYLEQRSIPKARQAIQSLNQH